MSSLTLALDIRDFLANNQDATIPEIAEALQLDEDVVSSILNTHLVEGDEITEVAPGQGGGWVPAAPMRPAEPEQLGYRWPDSKLREEPFNAENPEHRKLVGLE